MGTIATHDVVFEDDAIKVVISDAAVRDAGWIREGEQECYCHHAHCGDDSCTCVLAADAIEVVATWHNANHAYAFSFCDESPCADLRKADL